MPKHWRFASFDPATVSHLQAQTGVPTVVAQLLACRGIADPEDAKRFLEAKLTGLRDPDLLPGAPAAAGIIYQAVRDQRRVTIYGDYDADGMTGTAILLLCLRMLGANVDFYVPSRIDEGYGLNEDALGTLARRGTQLIITVDCGIASVHEADVARDLGIELVVTDHHQLGDALPDAKAIVHPRLPGHDYPFGELCGAAVAFKVAWAVCQMASEAKRVSEPLREFLLKAVGLAAIGTVCDVVPLIDENRILVRHGLVSLRERATPGIAALGKVSQINDKPQWEGEDIAFSLGPRLNAVGRLGQASLAVELLTTDSEERAAELADFVQQLNDRRQSLERSMLLAANRQIQQNFDPVHDAALVLADHSWHPGIIGIVAGRLADRYHRPVVMIALDELGVRPGVGSARSVAGLDVGAALSDCDEHLIACGGHAAAAGLTIRSDRVDAFRAHFQSRVAEMSRAHQQAEIIVDAEAPLTALTRKIVSQIESLAPFGHGNQRPVLCASEVRLAAAPKRIGGGGRHLSLSFEQHGVTLRAVAFGGGDWEEELAQVQGHLDVVFQPVINTFRGRSSVELHLADWRESQ